MANTNLCRALARLTALAVVAGASAASAGTINLCADREGDVHLPPSGQSCGSSQTTLTFAACSDPNCTNLAGPPGPIGPAGPQGPQGPAGDGSGGNSVAYADSVFRTRFILANAPLPSTIATLDLPPGNWVIVGKAMASALSETTTSEAHCALVSGRGGATTNLDYQSVAMTLDVHHTVTVASPLTVSGTADGHLELQCQSVDTIDGIIENAQLWAVQVGTLNSTVIPVF